MLFSIDKQDKNKLELSLNVTNNPTFALTGTSIFYTDRHTKRQTDRLIENSYIMLQYIKISNKVGRIDSFQALARKLSFLSTELDIFDIQQHYVCILFIFQHFICRVLSFLTLTNMNFLVYGNGLAVLMTS